MKTVYQEEIIHSATQMVNMNKLSIYYDLVELIKLAKSVPFHIEENGVYQAFFQSQLK